MEGKVIKPKEEKLKEEVSEESNSDQSEPQDQEDAEELKTGEIVNYTKEVDTYVVDEEGNRLLCNEENKNRVQAKTLSLLFEIKQMLGKKKK